MSAVADDANGCPTPPDEVGWQFQAESHAHMERLRAARRAVAEHPAGRLVAQMETLRRSIEAVFRVNFAELSALLRAPSADPRLAFELVQNVRRSNKAEQYNDQLVQRLHNYLAGTYTLVEHVRTMMKHQPDDLKGLWNAERERRLGTSEVAFVSELRHYIQHYAHLPLRHRLAMSGPAAATLSQQFTVELVGGALSSWRHWTKPAQTFLEGKEAVALLPLVDGHFTTVVAANRWLLGKLAGRLPSLAPGYDDLVVRANAVLTGLDIDSARKFTEARTRQLASTEEPSNPV